MGLNALKTQLIDKAKELGFDAVGVAAPSIPRRDQDGLKRFLSNGSHGDMTWLAQKEDRRRDPKTLWPEVQSVISLGLNYGPAENPLTLLEHPDKAAISVYARGGDYHDFVKKRLKQLARWLVETGDPETDVKVFVDTAPVLERVLAAQAGLGWQGKHTNLVSTEFGSWLFLGEIYTNLDLPKDTPHEDRCGSCNACAEICPTNAFPAPYQLDAARCISYLTIESKGPIPFEFRRAIGNRVYGCDDCLAICPWNKFAQNSHTLFLAARPETTGQALFDYLDLDDAGFRTVFRGSPIKRLGRDRFLRNVLIALGNCADMYNGEGPNGEGVKRIKALLADSAPVVRGAAIWALSQCLSKDAFQELREQHADLEKDAETALEWHQAHRDENRDK